jgi:hypothetical protein
MEMICGDDGRCRWWLVIMVNVRWWWRWSLQVVVGDNGECAVVVAMVGDGGGWW